MPRQISLTRTPQKVETQAFKYTVTASSPQQMAAEIFVMRQLPLDPTTGTRAAQFEHVTSPTELTALPVNASLSGQYEYRVASFSSVFSKQEEADEAWAALQSDVNALIRALNIADVPLTSQTVVLDG